MIYCGTNGFAKGNFFNFRQMVSISLGIDFGSVQLASLELKKQTTKFYRCHIYRTRILVHGLGLFCCKQNVGIFWKMSKKSALVRANAFKKSFGRILRLTCPASIVQCRTAIVPRTDAAILKGSGKDSLPQVMGLKRQKGHPSGCPVRPTTLRLTLWAAAFAKPH